MAVTLRNQHGVGSGRVSSIGSRCVLIIRLRTRLAAGGIRNRAVTRNIARLILIATPARCTHLMPQERGDCDDECGAHQKRGRQHRQILEHRTHRSLTLSRSESCPFGPPNGLAALEPAGDPLARKGLPPPFGCPAAPLPRVPADPGVRSARTGSSPGRSAASYPAACFRPPVGHTHTSTACSVLTVHRAFLATRRRSRTAWRGQVTRVLASRHPTSATQASASKAHAAAAQGGPPASLRHQPGSRTACY